jgi:hypothetical protein
MTLRPLLAAAFALLAVSASAQDRDSSWASTEALTEARAGASLVVVAFIHSARQPRGSWGICPADGRVVKVERGAGLAFGDKVSAGVPCSAMPREAQFPNPVRRIPMAFMWDGTWVRLYFDSGRRLIDYQPLELRAARPPRFWPQEPARPAPKR